MEFTVESASFSTFISPCEEAVFVGKDRHGKDMYSVTINTLDELIKFINKYGDIIIKKRDSYEITIYDDWVE